MQKTFQEKLKEASEDFQTQTRGWDSPAMPEVFAYLKEYCATHDEYPYNSDVIDYILTKEAVHQDYKDALNTEVYLAQKDLRKEQERALDARMQAEGFIKVKGDMDYRGPAVLKAKQTMDWLAVNVNTEGKIISDGKGNPFFIPKGKRTRGFYLYNLKGYYQPITK